MASVTPARGDSVAPHPAALQVSPSRRGWRVASYVVALLAVGAVAWWVSTHPTDLRTSDTTVRASTPASTAVHVGVFSAPADFDRTLHVSGVRVFATATAPVTIVPRVCHGGSVNVTTTPENFCADLGPTEGATLESGDAIVLEVVGEDAGTVRIDRVRVAYRDGLQWGVQDAGARAEVVILDR